MDKEQMLDDTIMKTTDNLTDFFKSVTKDEDGYKTNHYKAMSSLLINSTRINHKDKYDPVKIVDNLKEFFLWMLLAMDAVATRDDVNDMLAEVGDIDKVFKNRTKLLAQDIRNEISDDKLYQEYIYSVMEAMFIYSCTEPKLTTDIVTKKLEKFSESVLVSFYEASDKTGVMERSPDDN